MTTRLLGAGLSSFPKAEEGIISGIPKPIDAEVPALRKPRRFVFILDKIQIPPKEINHYTNNYETKFLYCNDSSIDLTASPLLFQNFSELSIFSSSCHFTSFFF